MKVDKIQCRGFISKSLPMKERRGVCQYFERNGKAKIEGIF